MRRQKVNTTWSGIVSLIIVGLGIGWLIGLSVSPVISIVLTSLIASAGTVVAALSGLTYSSTDLEDTEPKVQRWQVNPLPLATLMLGILVGSIFGLLVRNYQLLGTSLSGEINKWTKLGVPKEQIVYGLLETSYPRIGFSTSYTNTLTAEVNYWTNLGLSKDEVVRRIFDQQYHLGLPSVTSIQADNTRLGSYLFAIDADECQNLIAGIARAKELNDEQQLVNELVSSPHRGLQQLPTIIVDVSILFDIVEKVICVSS